MQAAAAATTHAPATAPATAPAPARAPAPASSTEAEVPPAAPQAAPAPAAAAPDAPLPQKKGPTVTFAAIKQLRERCPFADMKMCKEALRDTAGDIDAAAAVLEAQRGA